MKIFISWSGKRSRETAEILRDWLPQVIQAVEPWVSPDIEKGKRWGKEIADNLEKSGIGIICLNRDNLHEDWINFEAGALSKTKDAYVCTFLLDINPTDIEEPLAQFQHTLFNKADMLKLLKTINNRLSVNDEKALNDKTLENVFTKFWPDFETKIKNLAKAEGIVKSPVRDIREITEEILELTREISKSSFQSSSSMKYYHNVNMSVRGNINNFIKLSLFLHKMKYRFILTNFNYNANEDISNVKFDSVNDYNLVELEALLSNNGFVVTNIDSLPF